jgi:hypothetical protein
MKLDIVTKDPIYRPTDIIVNITVAITDGRPDMLLNAVVMSVGLGTDATVVLILNFRMIILHSWSRYLKRCGQRLLEK